MKIQWECSVQVMVYSQKEKSVENVNVRAPCKYVIYLGILILNLLKKNYWDLLLATF